MFSQKLIKKLRDETPGCINRIHFNNAGAGLMPQPVVTAMKDYLDLEGEIGGYEAAELKEEEIQDFYYTLAEFLHCKASNIAFTFNATDSYARALSSIPFKKEDIILTSMNDYISNQIAFLSLKKRLDIRVMRVPDQAKGGIHVDQAENMIRMFNPVLVAITHVPTNSGLVQDIEAIGQMCQDRDILYLVDACQSVGQMDIDTEKIRCDFLSATFRKFLRGPRGAGFLYVSDKVLDRKYEPLFIDMRGADWTAENSYRQQLTAKRFEQWEFPYALLLGGKTSVKYAMEAGIDRISHRTFGLAELIRNKLSGIKGLRVLDRGRKKSGIVTFWLPGWEGEKLKLRLNELGINCSIALKQDNIMDFTEKDVEWAIRVSPHYYNTEDEVEEFVAHLEEIHKSRE